MAGSQGLPVLEASGAVYSTAVKDILLSLRYDITVIQLWFYLTLTVIYVYFAYACAGKACRVKVCHKLRQKFKSPAAAEKHYVLQREALAGLQPSEQVAVLSELFSAYLRHCNLQAVEPEFLELAARGMQHLHEKGQTNVIYSMVKAVGTMHSDGSDSLLPAERMPMGLIEYAVNFFTASSVQKVNINVCAYYDHRNLHSVTQLSCINGMGVSLLQRVFLIVHGRKL